MKRRLARELVLQLLFQTDMIKEEPNEKEVQDFLKQMNAPKEIWLFVLELVKGTLQHKDAIDNELSQSAKNWNLDRMAVVDRNILRLAIFELLYKDDIPMKVTINEAIELAKRYSTIESPSFINGILDKIAKGKKR